MEQLIESLHSERAITPPRPEAPQPPRWGRALYRLLAGCFWAAGHLSFDIRARGFEHYTNRPSTLVVCNHKTDFDIILLVPILRHTHRSTGPVAHLSFMAAERMFQANYLSTYVLPRPHWLSRLLYPLDVGAVLPALRGHPMPHARRRKLRAHLRELLEFGGNLPLAQLFRQSPQRFVPGAAPDTRIVDVLGWKHRQALDVEYGFSIFQQPLAKQLRVRHRERLSSSLTLFAGILDAGAPLYIAPEGDLSPDGRLGHFKAGLGQIVRLVDRPLTILPVHFTYDVMTTGRPTAFVSLGPEWRNVGTLSGERLNAELRRRLLKLCTVTMGQLASRALRLRAEQGLDRIPVVELRTWIGAQAQELTRKGLHVDERLLEPKSYQRRWRRFLAHCRRKKLLRRAGDQLLFDPQAFLSSEPCENAPPHSWRYQENELTDAMSLAEPHTSAQPLE